MTTLAQTQRIHALRRQIPHFTEEDYRALLAREFKAASSKDLTSAQAYRLIDILAPLAGDSANVRRASETATGPYADKLRALWISGYHLGVIRQRHDKAMISFVERQTGLSHTRFLNDATAAARAIEALKDMLMRGGVEWPKKDESEGAIETKRAVCKAVAKAAFEAGAFETWLQHGFERSWPWEFVEYGWNARATGTRSLAEYTPRDWDNLAAALGRKLRVHLAAKKSGKKPKGKRRAA